MGRRLFATGAAPGAPNDRGTFESAIQAIEADIANVGAHLWVDSTARRLYTEQIKLVTEELRAQVGSGKLTWAQAAAEAGETRNAIMHVIRGRSTPIGRAMAQQLKSQGKTLNQLVARKTEQLYGRNASFKSLTDAQQGVVYAEIVKSAGKSNPAVTAMMAKLSYAGRGLLAVALASSIYEIMNAEDKTDRLGRELVVTGAGIGGGFTGGALAGLACGPGAPVCATIGAFVGGTLAAFGVDALW